MPLEPPSLDTRTFEQIFEEARARIPRYAPQWTDFNESDPGITLLQLFSWLTELLLHEMNRVPERNYRKFLQLLGMELRPPQTAIAHLTFTPQAGVETASVPERTQIGAQPPGGGEPLTFETDAGLDLIRAPLARVMVYDGAFGDLTTANETPGTPFRPFGWSPQVGSALYLGFEPTMPPAPSPIFPQGMRFRVFLPPSSSAHAPEVCTGASRQPPAPPVTLVWEYRPTATRWRRLNVFEDGTAGLTREGSLLVEGPREPVPTQDGGQTDKDRYWIRVRVAAGAYPSGQVPEIDLIRPNVVMARNAATVRDEILGESNGHPDQAFLLRRTPVLPDSLVVEVEERTGTESWTRVDDFLASTRDDPHYVLNHVTGEVRFGGMRPRLPEAGLRGRIPEAGATIVARAYRFGGGTAGNVPANLVNTVLTPLQGVESVTNERPSVGGADEQPVEELMEEAPRRLRSQDRAVTPDDFTALAEQAGGVARAVAVAQAHPDHAGVLVPGAVTVAIVPESDDHPPIPSPQLLQQVCADLDGHRLLTTELFVTSPDYHKVTVRATVAADPYAAFDEVKQKVVEALNDHLAPLIRRTGLEQTAAKPKWGGWPFGQDFYPTHLFGVILGVEHVREVRTIEVLVDDLPRDQLGEPFRVGPAGLIWGAPDHQITIEPLQDR